MQFGWWHPDAVQQCTQKGIRSHIPSRSSNASARRFPELTLPVLLPVSSGLVPALISRSSSKRSEALRCPGYPRATMFWVQDPAWSSMMQCSFHTAVLCVVCCVSIEWQTAQPLDHPETSPYMLGSTSHARTHLMSAAQLALRPTLALQPAPARTCE
eukprot:2354804-Rhodomonas_salina.2